MRRLDLGREAIDFLEYLPPKQYRQVMRAVIDLLANPKPHDSATVKGHPDVLRVTIGEYRIAYSASDELVTVWAIGKRNDDEVYKTLNRKT